MEIKAVEIISSIVTKAEEGAVSVGEHLMDAMHRIVTSEQRTLTPKEVLNQLEFESVRGKADLPNESKFKINEYLSMQ